MEIRPATLDDLAVLTETMRLGFETYRAFAPRGWDPPPPVIEQARIADRLPLPDAWCMIAEEDGQPAGHVAVLAARERTPARAVIPGQAYLWTLFVRRPWWGSGLASRLHRLAIEEAAGRRVSGMRLETPAGQARARAFYEREGWSTDGATWFEPLLGLELVEYRRAF